MKLPQSYVSKGGLFWKVRNILMTGKRRMIRTTCDNYFAFFNQSEFQEMDPKLFWLSLQKSFFGTVIKQYHFNIFWYEVNLQSKELFVEIISRLDPLISIIKTLVVILEKLTKNPRS